MADLQIERQPKQARRMIFNGLVAGAAGGWIVYDSLPGRETFWIVLGALFVVWSAFIFYNFFTRKVYLQTDAYGLTVFSVLGKRRALFTDMAWSNIDPEQRVSVIAYRAKGSERDRFLALSTATIGKDGISALADILAKERPDLPNKSPNT